MADSQQGVRHQSARDAAGTVDTYDGDLRALFNAVATVPAGSTFNEAFMLWLQSVTGSSADNINDLAALYASQQDDTYNWSSVGSLGLPTLFDVDFEAGGILPVSATFARASVAQVLTTTDGTTNWYTEVLSGELRLDGLRRVENFQVANRYIDLTNWSLVGGASATATVLTVSSIGDGIQSLTGIITAMEGQQLWFVAELSGSGTISMEVGANSSNLTEVQVTLSATPTLYAISTDSIGSGQTRIRGRIRKLAPDTATSITVGRSGLFMEQVGNSTLPPPVFDPATIFNAEVAGVQYFGKNNGNSVNGTTFVVTEASGTTITGGGFLSEPAATNQMPENDLSDAAWTKDDVTIADNGVNELGLREYEIDVGTSTATHRIRDNAFAGSAGSAYAIAKEGTGRYMGIQRGASTTTDFAMFDLQTGTITEEGSTIDDALITDRGNGYHKGEINTSSTSATFRIGVADSATPGNVAPSFTGADETILVSHEQYENTVYSTSPIITSGSTVTRVADVLDTGAVIDSEFGALLDVTLPDVIGPGNTITLLGPDATAEDVLRIDASFNIIMDDGGTPATIGTSSAGSRIKISYGRSAAGRSGSLDGATVVTGDAPGSGHEGDTFQLGSANSVSQSRCLHHDSVIYSVRPSDSQLESLSS